MSTPGARGEVLERRDNCAVSVDHYENFPVASLLCPAELRPTVTAIYWFARTADDIADEGNHSITARLDSLHAYRADLEATLAGQPVSAGWPRVFETLARAMQRHQLPAQPLRDLLDAFTQDASNPLYDTRGQLLDYCRRSANPIGRLLLHLYRISDATSLSQSDAVCTSLQLINFWQDLSVDLPRGRVYLPLGELAARGLELSDLQAKRHDQSVKAMVRGLCDWAGKLMHEGAPLAQRVPGRAGWELRLVVQGGLRILDKIGAMGYDTVHHRPTLARADAFTLVWRALTMKPNQ